MKPIHTFAAALALSTALTGTALAATKVGVIGAANPQVYVEREGGAKTVLRVGDEIFLNDKLSTDGKGSAQLMFLDKSALTISPESLVTIDTFVYDPAAKDGTMTVNGAKGAFRFIGGALTKKKAVNFKTPVSTIGIRGGIVDTHIAAGGQTDAVFLFGKEMTMTNAAGQTSSTTQFGTGIGLTNAGAAPVNLPQNVVSARINASPTQAAVAAAPPASPAQINALEGKVQMDTGAKTGANQGGVPAEPSGGANASPSPAGESNNDGGNGNEGPRPAEAPQQEGNAGSTGGNAPIAEAAAPVANTPANGGFAEGAGLKAEPIAPINVNTAALGGEDLRAEIDNFVNKGGDGDGDGQVDFDVTVEQALNIRTTRNEQGLAETGESRSLLQAILEKDEETAKNYIESVGGTEKFEEDFKEALFDNPEATQEFITIDDSGEASERDTAEDSMPEETDTVFLPPSEAEQENDAAPTSPSSPNNAPYFTGSTNLATGNEHDLLQNRRRTFTQAELLAGINDTEGDALSVVAGSLTVAADGSTSGLELTADDIAPGDTRTITVNYDVTDGTNTINVTRDIVITGQDFFGGTTAWDTTTHPTMPLAATKRGKMFHRAENTGGSSTIEVGKLEAFTGTSDTTDGNYVERYAGKHVFHMEKEAAFTNDYSSAVALPAANDPSNFVIGYINMPAGSGMKTLLETDVHLEDNLGRVRVNANNDFTGFGYETADGSFSYAQAKWMDINGTPVDSTDDELIHLRSTMNSTPLLSATDTTDAQTKYDAMLGEAISNATVTGGIVEYDFLPELSASTSGMIDYNYASGLSAHGYHSKNDNGLFIDWASEKFLGGYVDFTGNAAGESGIRVLFGKVNAGANAVTSFNAGDGGSGIALDGSYYTLNQKADFASSNNEQLFVNAASESLASTGATGAAIEALIVQTDDGTDTTSRCYWCRRNSHLTR